jgi:hypothetical protein
MKLQVKLFSCRFRNHISLWTNSRFRVSSACFLFCREMASFTLSHQILIREKSILNIMCSWCSSLEATRGRDFRTVSDRSLPSNLFCCTEWKTRGGCLAKPEQNHGLIFFSRDPFSLLDIFKIRYHVIISLEIIVYWTTWDAVHVFTSEQKLFYFYCMLQFLLKLKDPFHPGMTCWHEDLLDALGAN